MTEPKNSLPVTTPSYCVHEVQDSRYNGHRPKLHACEIDWIETVLNDYLKGCATDLKSTVDLLGIDDERQVRALKRRITELVHDVRHKVIGDELWPRFHIDYPDVEINEAFIFDTDHVEKDTKEELND